MIVNEIAKFRKPPMPGTAPGRSRACGGSARPPTCGDLPVGPCAHGFSLLSAASGGVSTPPGSSCSPPGSRVDSRAMLTLDELTKAVADGSIDTVIVAFTDMQGRLMGKRLHGEFFVEEHVGEHGVEGCNYLLALDMEMDPVRLRSRAGSRATATAQASTATLRRIPWLEATALVLCDVAWHGRRSRPPAPAVLQAAGRARDRSSASRRCSAPSRVLPPQGDLRGGARQALPRPDAVRPLHPTTTSSPPPTTSR